MAIVAYLYNAATSRRSGDSLAAFSEEDDGGYLFYLVPRPLSPHPQNDGEGGNCISRID